MKYTSSLKAGDLDLGTNMTDDVSPIIGYNSVILMTYQEFLNYSILQVILAVYIVHVTLHHVASNFIY